MLNLANAEGFMFDCDGTLLDTLDAWDAAEAELFAQAGPLTQEQEDEIHSAPIGEAAAILHSKYGVGDSAEAVLAHLDSQLLPFYGERAEALPGAVEFVKAVSDARIPCVVLSSSPRRYLEAGLSRIGILSCFSELVTTDETGCSKRDFAIYERALGILDCTCETAWAVDDAPYALAVMRAFGLNTIAVGNGCSRQRAEKLRESATLYANTLEELLA